MKRKIPKKNYILVLLLSLSTIILTFILVNTYNNNKVSNKRINFISEIKENELKNYITETDEAIVYMSKSNNEKNNLLEEELKEYTLKQNLEDKYVYLDLSLVDNNFYNDFYLNYIKESYTGNFEIKEPTMVIINKGKVKTYINNIDKLEEIKDFFVNNGVVE